MGNLRIYYLYIKDLSGFSGEADVGMNLEIPENAILTNIDGVDGQQTMNVVKLAGLKESGLNCQ